MNHVSVEILKISGSLEEAELKAPASKLAILAEEIAQNDRLLTVAEASECGRQTLDQKVNDRRIDRRALPLRQKQGTEADEARFLAC